MTKNISGFLWKLLERFSVLGSQFVLQLILARLLTPDHYGVLSIMIIFTTVANVFIQTGFNTSLIQNKDVTENDYSSVFWVTSCVATVLYFIIFFSAPWIAAFYNMPKIATPLRVLALMLFPGALNSVQLAKVSRELNFKIVFISNLVAVLGSGIIGIIIALCGGGLWALVVQSLLQVSIAAIVMLFTVNWHPTFICEFFRIKVLFSFGWKILVSGLIDTIYQNLQSLVVGKKYNSETLGFFNRGQQFPQVIISAINGTVQSVMLPVMSAKQEKRQEVKQIMRRSITLCSYLVFPMMAGLIAIANPLIELLLTAKWLAAVPYLQVFCIVYALYPIQSCNLQAINAMGRSDIFLKLEIIKKIYGVIICIVSVVFFRSPMAIAISGVISAIVSTFVNAWPNKKLIGYSYMDQVRDLVPSLLMSAIMCACVYSINFLSLNLIIKIILQILCGTTVYLLLSALFHIECYTYLCNVFKNKLRQ